MARDNHWGERWDRRKRDRQNSSAQPTRSNSMTDEPAASPSPRSPDPTLLELDRSFSAVSYESTRSSASTRAVTSRSPFASRKGSECSLPVPSVSVLANPDQGLRRRNSSFGDREYTRNPDLPPPASSSHFAVHAEPTASLGTASSLQLTELGPESFAIARTRERRHSDPGCEALLTSPLILHARSSSAPSDPSPGYIGIENIYKPIGYQRPLGRLGHKSLKKQARGPRVKKFNPVLEKETTAKLTKFWNVVEAGDQEGCFDSFDSVESHCNTSISTSEPPVLPEIPCIGGLDIGLSTVAEDKAEDKAEETTDSADMHSSHLSPMSFNGPKRELQVKDAVDMQNKVLRLAERTGTQPPPYVFIELIGKGGFGRVYKCTKTGTGDVVAVKITDIDKADYEEYAQDRSNAINSFRREVDMLSALKDSERAKNILEIYEAFDFGTQLWIVSEYCTGGSIRTLMRAWAIGSKARGMDEEYIIPLARETMIAIKSVHDMGVIHRDLKCSNIYVTEEGDLRLGDFGIVSEEDPHARRRTVIGTPHYMAPEMAILQDREHDETLPGYEKNVDIWSFGLTVLEMATGLPPHHTVGSESIFRTVSEHAATPRLENDNYSQELHDFIAFCVNPNPKERPGADDVLKHPYIANTSKKYPMRSLARLVERYTVWEYKGGQRQSLFYEGGAKAPGSSEDDDFGDVQNEDGEVDWNFSTSETFNVAFGKRYSRMVATQDFAEKSLDAPNALALPPLNTKDLTPFQRVKKHHEELSAGRGERSLERLWGPDSDPYEIQGSGPKFVSDLPLRNMASTAPTRESLIDLDSAGGLDMDAPPFNFDFGDVPTLKARASRQVPRDEDDEEKSRYGESGLDEKRATMEWTFPGQEKKRATLEWTFPKQQAKSRATMEWTFAKAETLKPDESDASSLQSARDRNALPQDFRPTLKHAATEPVVQYGDFAHSTQRVMPMSDSPVRTSTSSMIDLDMGLGDPAEIVRPSTASSATGSAMTDMTSGNPFDLEEDPEQNEIDRNRFSHHKQWQSEGGRLKRSSHKTMPMHSRGNSLTSNGSELDLRLYSTDTPDALEYDYDVQHRAMESAHPPHLVTDPGEAFDTNHWPDFGSSSGLDDEPTYVPNYLPRLGDPDFPLQQGLQTQGLSMHPPSRNGGVGRSHGPRRELEIPDAVAPYLAALHEDADPQALMAEMDRLLEDFQGTLRSTSRAFREYAGVDDEETEGEGSASGVDSGNTATGDEDGF